MKNKEQKIYFNKPLFQRPTFSEMYENIHSKVINENSSCNEQSLRKEMKDVHESEIETSSESDDEFTQKITLRHEP